MRLPTSARFSICLLALAASLVACSKSDGGSEDAVSVTTSEVDVGGIVKMRKETRSPVADEEEDRDRPVPQAGNLTAGDYDDILNPELYARYAKAAARQQDSDLPFVDTRTRVAVKVIDADGRPVPQARIDVARDEGSLHLVSGADGVASFYPRFDGIGDAPRIDVSSDAGSAGRKVQLTGRGQQTVTFNVSGEARPVSALDLVIVLDATGSMDDEMAYLQAELDSIVSRLQRDAGGVDLRIGVVVYRDEGDDYVTRSFELSSDIGSAREMLERQSAAGGGDNPEAVDQAMVAAERMQWRNDAAKAVLLIADAPPHSEGIKATFDATERLRAEGVQIVPVAASGVEDSAQYIMRTMAVLTHGRYIFLTDDSGIGNPHAEPDVACYVVTRLDQLIARVLAGIVEGRRIEPARSEVIRTVGDYNAGRCGEIQDSSS